MRKVHAGVPAPAPSGSVAAPAPGTVIAANGTVLVPAPAVGTPPAGAPTPSLLTTSNASAQSPDAGSIAGIESSNTTAGVPGLAPSPSTAEASAVPTPAEAAPAVAPSTTTSTGAIVPALAPVSSTTSQYQNVADAPASWNSSAYSTATVQITVTNTSVTGFDTPTQTALLNALNSYLQAQGYSNFYMGLNGISGAVAVVQASPGAAAAAPAEGLPPGVSVTVVVTPVDNSTAATPLTAQASPAPARRLLADTVTSSGTGVDVNITITAPASDLNNITALVSEAVQSGQVQQQLQAAGVNISLTRVNVEVVIAGLPGVITVPAVSSPSPVAVLPPSPPAATSKSAGVPIGAVAGGIAGGAVVIVGGGLLTCLLCKRRRRRRQWTKDLETAKAGYSEDPRGSSDSGSSANSGRPGGLGRKVAAYMPFGTNSNESVDATPHAKHATMDDSFAGISRFKPDGTLNVHAPRLQLISSAAPAHQMGTIPERKSYSGDAAGVHLHDTANLLDSHSNSVQTAADHALLSPVSLFSFGTPVSRSGQASIVDPFRPAGMVSRPSEGKLSSDGSTNLMRGGSGDQLLGAHASGDYSDRFQELAVEPIASRKGSNASGRQYSGNVDANLWSVAWKDLEIQKQIGEGSFGKVFLAKWRETTVAVKLLTYTGVSGSLEDNDEFVNQGMNVLLKGLEQEAGMMASMRHPNVVMYLGVCLQPPCVVTEYCARGSLNDVFKRARATPALAAQLDWGRRLNMVLDAAKGMMYLHSSEPPVIHRDLKSPNLLVDKHWRIKVCDFNLSRVMEESAILSSMAASNPRWLAPEILSGRGYTFSSDVYSFGVIMWEFLTWQIPWHECGPWQVVALVTEGAQRPELPAPEDLPGTGAFAGYSEYIMLMEQCWDQDPAARPTFAQVITVLRKMLAAEMRAKSSNNAELNPQKSASPSV
ncbi:MAG: kinase [Trebouxia sp. A1-2]|nr:MAG: kinase [Trebouxia sp. A1-2]